jgi:hypothetical protein
MPRTLTALLLAVALTSALACGGVPATSLPLPSSPIGATEPTAPGKPADAPTADWSKVGDTAKVGDVTVTVLSAGPRAVFGRRGGAYSDLGKGLGVVVRLSNASPTKLVRFTGWGGLAKAADEHGNEYSWLAMPAGFGLDPEVLGLLDKDANGGCTRSASAGGPIDLHPGKCYTTVMLFDPVIDQATEVRITAPATALGGSGAVMLRGSIMRPKK